MEVQNPAELSACTFLSTIEESCVAQGWMYFVELLLLFLELKASSIGRRFVGVSIDVIGSNCCAEDTLIYVFCLNFEQFCCGPPNAEGSYHH